MRTLDEEIAHQREVAEKIRTEHNCECDYYDIDIDCVKCAEEHEQLAEWLEELKMLRELKEEHRKIGNIEGFNKGYNKAIDDFVEAVKRRFPYDKNGVFHIEIIAEQLKAGGENGQRI